MRGPKAPSDHQMECADGVVLSGNIARICRCEDFALGWPGRLSGPRDEAGLYHSLLPSAVERFARGDVVRVAVAMDDFPVALFAAEDRRDPERKGLRR